MSAPVLQPPVRNASTIGASVYSHSGEFAPAYADLRSSGRGLGLDFVRAYRSSLADQRGVLGRGWSVSIARRVERDGEDMIYHDGSGRAHRFVRGTNGRHISPAGFYGVLLEAKEGVQIRHRFGRMSRFDAADRGGRIRVIEDRNQNTITFSNRADRIAIVDTLSRRVTAALAKGLLRRLTDHAGRQWTYVYDGDDRLVEVVQPATDDFPRGTSVRYGYDDNHRLISVTDAKGQTYLVNRYDSQGRVSAQEHGNGTFRMDYEVAGRGARGARPYRTTCLQKNGGTLTLEHNDAGNVVSRTLQVHPDSFSAEDVAGGGGTALVTTSSYNGHAELVKRTFPAGSTTEWAYTDDDEDPLNRGNLVRVTETPQRGVASEQTSLVTILEHDRAFQLPTSVTDPRGNTTTHRYSGTGDRIATAYAPVTVRPVNGASPRTAQMTRTQETAFAYNSRGQLLRQTHIDGSLTTYDYYPAADPMGSRGPGTATSDPDVLCGYLARITRDAAGARVKNEYAYDRFGNLTSVRDGKSNAARLRYNAMGMLERIQTREPFGYAISYRYDANYNEIESAQSFERLEHDAVTGKTAVRSSTLRELKDYDVLDKAVARTIAGDDKRITERFIRDVAERVVRHLQPSGNSTLYVFDERDLLLKKTFGAGTRDEFSERYTYTRDGAVRSRTDGNGHTTTHRYDGFHRYKGSTDPLGASRTHWLDETGNVVRIAIDGASDGASKRSTKRRPGRAALMEVAYHFDEWDRVYRVDEAWRDEAGRSLGSSNWDGTEGVVSMLVEYAEDGRPGRLWAETGNVVSLTRDGLGRICETRDLSGEGSSIEYDENGNATTIIQRVRDVDGEHVVRVLRRRYDEMDRLVAQQENDGSPERFRYNALGSVIAHVSRSGLEIQHAHDGLGRYVGHAFTVRDQADGVEDQRIARSFDYDDDFRLYAYTDAAENRTTYRYDALDRQIGVEYPDGSSVHAGYDAAGNIVTVVDQNGTEASAHYDAANRLIERRSRPAGTDRPEVERFEYDGVGRLIAASSASAVARMAYDSLSQLLTEAQSGRVIRHTYDVAGNATTLTYPSGDQVGRTFDVRGHVTSVTDAAGATIATFSYRSGEHVSRMVLGGIIEAESTYDGAERLETIEYRRSDDGRLVDGFHYQYDDAGRMIHEIQSSRSPTFGERYSFDTANRPVRAQYGVQDVFDHGSPVDHQTSYEHLPEGPWKRRVDIDGQGRVLKDLAASADQRNRYLQFGDVSFAYDAAGNCIRKGTANPGFCLYAYDAEHRLVKAECFDARAERTQTIEYFYDPLGRQIRKVVTDSAGDSTEYSYVWAGSLLIEEYENGVLVRSYVYGVGSQPVRLAVTKHGRSDYFYVHNGRGSVSGLVLSTDPNAFAEKYIYELTGAAHVKEINGVSVALPSRGATRSALLNSIISGSFGSIGRDWHNGTLFSASGTHMDPTIAGILNSNSGLFGKGHKGMRGAMNEQFRGYLAVLGRAGQAPGPTVSGQGPSFQSRKMSLYAGGADGGNPAFDFSGKSPGTGGGSTSGGSGPKDSRIQWIQDVMSTPITLGPSGAFETTPRALVGGVVSGLKPGDPANTGPPPAGQLNPAQEAGETQKKEAADNAEAEKAKSEAVERANEAAKEKAKEKKKDEEEGAKKKYIDPDAPATETVTFPSPREVETKLNQRKRPMNPNGGFGAGGQIDTSSPPPRLGGMDPTKAYFIDEPFAGIDTGGALPAGATPRYVPGYGPFAPDAPQMGGGEPSPDAAWPWVSD